MKQSRELVATFSKRILIGPRKLCHYQLESSNTTWGMKLSAKAELNFKIYKILKKLLESQVSFLSSQQPWEPKSLDVCLEYCRSWKIRSENLRLRSILEANPFKFWMKAALVTIGGNLRSLWMVILKSVWFIAGIQLAVSCNELNFLRCFSLKLTGTNRKTLSYVFI